MKAGKPMHQRILRHLRTNVVAYLALFLSVGAGSGYAIAAGNNKTIHGCVDNGTRLLHVQKRCHRGQSRLIWNQQGPQGQSPITAWAAVNALGFTGAGARGIAVQHPSTGVYSVTATPSACTQVTDAPTVTVDTAFPGGQFPVAWEAHSGSARNTFTVFTGVVVGGSFTPTDEAFNVQVPCS